LKPSTFEPFLAASPENVILVYSSINSDPCDDYMNMFEELAHYMAAFVPFSRIDCASDSALAAQLNVLGMPTVAFFRNFSGEVLVSSLRRLIHTVTEMRQFIVSHWAVNVAAIPDLATLKNFLLSTPGQPKVLQIVRRSEPTIDFMQMATRHVAVAFGVVDTAQFPDFPFAIPGFPSYIAYRHARREPRIVITPDRVKELLNSWAIPTMLELSHPMWEVICGAECAVRIGHVPDIQELDELFQWNFSTFWIRQDSQAAKTFNGEVGDWIFLRPKERLWTAIRKEGVKAIEKKWKMRTRLAWMELPQGFTFAQEEGIAQMAVGFVASVWHNFLSTSINTLLTGCMVLFFVFKTVNPCIQRWRMTHRPQTGRIRTPVAAKAKVD
jgi:hypothetical protein